MRRVETKNYKETQNCRNKEVKGKQARKERMEVSVVEVSLKTKKTRQYKMTTHKRNTSTERKKEKQDSANRTTKPYG